MIDANSTIVFKCLPEIVPEGELSLQIRMQRPKCVDVAKLEKISIFGARLGLKECVAYLRQTNSSQRRARNLLPQTVFQDRPVYQEEHAAQLIMARRISSPHKGRIRLRRSVDRPFAFPLQSDSGPYI
jgi:hypothetical protein